LTRAALHTSPPPRALHSFPTHALPISQHGERVMTSQHRPAADRRSVLTEEIVARTGIDEAMIDRLVRRFYARIRNDDLVGPVFEDRKSTRLNSSHVKISYAVFCLKKKK